MSANLPDLRSSEVLPIYVGFDPRELVAYNVAEQSIRGLTKIPNLLRRITILSLYPHYTRETITTARTNTYFDVISQAPMTTAHAIARFFIPWLCDYKGWAIFLDGDVLVRRDLGELYALRDEQYAVHVVKHQPALLGGTKKTGQPQQPYYRKNWSSVMLINCGHPANRALTLDAVNTWPGRDLHAFRWLNDEQIGALPSGWNYLVGQQPSPIDPAIVHYTLGTPLLAEHAHGPFTDEWWSRCRAHGYKVERPEMIVDARVS